MKDIMEPIRMETHLAKCLVNFLTLAALLIFFMGLLFSTADSPLFLGKWLFLVSAVSTSALNVYMNKNPQRFTFFCQCFGVMVFNIACHLSDINVTIAEFLLILATIGCILSLLYPFLLKLQQR